MEERKETNISPRYQETRLNTAELLFNIIKIQTLIKALSHLYLEETAVVVRAHTRTHTKCACKVVNMSINAAQVECIQ